MKTFREFIEEAYLYEMRKEDKVKGKKKTPLTIDRTRTVRLSKGTVRPAEEGSGKKWKVTPPTTVTATDVTYHPTASMGRYRQGGSGGFMYGYTRHPHGGAADWTPAGSQRGKKKVPGEKKPEIGHVSSAERLAAKKAARKYAAGATQNIRRKI